MSNSHLRTFAGILGAITLLLLILASCVSYEAEPVALATPSPIIPGSPSSPTIAPSSPERTAPDEYPVPMANPAYPGSADSPTIREQQLLNDIAYLERLLADPSLTAAQRQEIEAVLYDLQMLAEQTFNVPTRTEAEWAEVRAFATLAAQYTPEPTSTPELGIVPTDSWLYEYVFHEMKGIRYLTIWQGFIAENFTRVFAGQTWPNEALGDREIYYYGLLYIYTTIAGQTTRAEVRTEEETGPFRIIDATDDNFLTLESAGHGVLGPQRFLFNVATLELQLLAD